MASRISSRYSSATPARRATATATSLAVRTCAGAGENDSRTVAIGYAVWFGSAPDAWVAASTVS